jgi:hypothetical protein
MDCLMPLLATVLAPMIFAIQACLCRTLGSRHAVRWMFVAFTGYIVVFAVVAHWLWLPPCTSESWVPGLAATGFWSLMYMQVFSMLCRGFSLNVLVHCAEHRKATLPEVMANYQGVGADTLLEKRLASLERLHLIRRKPGAISLGGRSAAALSFLTAAYKRLFRLGPGG